MHALLVLALGESPVVLGEGMADKPLTEAQRPRALKVLPLPPVVEALETLPELRHVDQCVVCLNK